MEKKVISKFYHEHPLILTENAGNDERRPKSCYGCRKPIANAEMAYICLQEGCSDGCILHKKCGELPDQISHPRHSKHPLDLFYSNMLHDNGGCESCGICWCTIQKAFGYQCTIYNFNVDIKCAEASIEEMKELQHPSHPHHSLTLFRNPRFSFRCNGCGDQDADTAYICSTCEFWLHKSCASLPNTLHIDSHHHPLSLIFSLPKKHIKYRYVVHIKCVTRSSATKPDVSKLSSEEDDGDVIEFPLHANDIPDKLIPPFVKRENKFKGVDTANTSSSGTSSNTSFLLKYYHEHPLRLVSEFTHKDVDDEEKDEEEDNDQEEEEELKKICDMCITPISNNSAPYYECGSCTYSIHSICSLPPPTLQYSTSSSNNLNSILLFGDCGGELNKNHNFTLFKSEGNDAVFHWYCDLCDLYTNGMGYECTDCGKKIDVKCASLPTSIRHASHTSRHHKPLSLTSIPSEAKKKCCHGCNRAFIYNRHAYWCNVEGCDFALHLRCAVLPLSVRDREWDKHPLMLTFDPSLDHPSDFFCEFCESEMHPKNWMYHCRHCDASFHFYCLDTASGYYRNMKLGGRYEFEEIHPKHPLTYTCVTLKKRCDLCQRDWAVYTWLGFECASCYYVLCRGCGVAELDRKKKKLSLC